MLRSSLRRIVLSLELQTEHEIINHASAGAYAFLLSVVPALLLSFGIAILVLQPLPKTNEVLFKMVSDFFNHFGIPNAAPVIYSSTSSWPSIAFWIVGMIWSASLFFATIRKGLKVIWSYSTSSLPAKRTIWLLTSELAGLAILIAILGATEIASLILYTKGGKILSNDAARAVIVILSHAALSVFVFCCYHYFSPLKPKIKTSIAMGILCVLLYAAFSSIMHGIVNIGQYTVMYGVIGNIAKSLFNVFIFFYLFFFCATLVYVEENYDALLFGRYHQTATNVNIKKSTKTLFGNNAYLINRYGKSLRDGQYLFKVLDNSRSAFYIDQGCIEIFLPDAQGNLGEKIAALHAGEFFGEMAFILNEPRSASARSQGNSTILELPPAVFSYYLQSSPHASRSLIAMLAERLKLANARKSSFPSAG